MPGKRRTRRVSSREQIRVGHRSRGRPIRPGIRWDRVPGGWLVAIVLVMAALYVPPLHSYYQQRKETSAQKAQLQRLGKENRKLRARAKALRRASTIELEARRLGMVKDGERPYVILR